MTTLNLGDSYQRLSSIFTKILNDEGVNDQTIESEVILSF